MASAAAAPPRPLRPDARDAGPELSATDVAKFTATAAAAAIFVDAAVGHGLLWENDPYWTYWVTKTFLIATVFGMGTALSGIGELRGAVITAVHTVVLTVYYWTFSPVGLPSSPEWLDLEHTWLTGVPVHFGVIYAGYLVALGLWRRRGHGAANPSDDTRALALQALVAALAIVVIAGGASSLALWEFPGVTWFLVRLLITLPVVYGIWALAGRDLETAVVGALLLAFVWATYGHFLGPSGLPDAPLRVFDPDPPPATVHWLSYRDLWIVSLPIYAFTMALVLLIAQLVASEREPSP